MMMKSSLLVIVFLAVIATVRSENAILDAIRRGFGDVISPCKWKDDENYPSFDYGQTIEVLDGCYTCTFGSSDCKLKCDPNQAKKCNPRKNGVCLWTGTGLPKMMPREDFYKDDCYVCEFSVKDCEFMCWNMCSESAKRKRLLALLEDLTSD